MSLDYEHNDVIGFALFGMSIPIYNGTAFLDPAIWTEKSASSGGFGHKSGSATVWSEVGS